MAVVADYADADFGTAPAGSDGDTVRAAGQEFDRFLAAVSVSFTLNTDGSVTLANDLTVDDDAVISGAFAVTGESIFTGFVGIGGAPERRLHVQSAAATDIHMTNDATGHGISAGSTFTLSGVNVLLNNRSGGIWNFTNGNVTIDDNLSVVGTLSKGAGSFKIDHPLPDMKDTHWLVHSFYESHRAYNAYKGRVTLSNGTASVNIDEAAGMTEGTFEALNRSDEAYSDARSKTTWSQIRCSVDGNILNIEAKDSNSAALVEWDVVAERHDPMIKTSPMTDDDGRVIVEPLKPVETKELD